MRLSDWIEKKGLDRVEAGRLFGVSASTVWLLCRENGWPAKRALAERIRHVTGGLVQPNDFLPPQKPARK